MNRESAQTRLAGGLFLLTCLLLVTACSSNKSKLAYTDTGLSNWLTPRANPANTGQAPTALLNEPYTILWSTRTGGVAATEPIVRDGLIFFAGLDRRAEVYDLATGNRRFRKRFDGPVVGIIPFDSTFGVLVDQTERRYFTFDLRTGKERSNFRVPNVSCAPRVLNDTTVLLGTWGGTAICVTSSGAEVWKTECEGPILNPPAIRDSVAYVSGGRSLFALNARNGIKLWEHGLSGAIEGSPALDDHAYCGTADSQAVALNAHSGDIVWTARLGGGVFSTPAVGTQLVYFASNDGMISALDKESGNVEWAYPTGAIANLSPTLAGDYLLATSRHSVLSVLSAATGTELWSDTTLTGQAMTSPVVVGDRIILTDSRRLLICLAPATGTAKVSSAIKD